MIKPLSQLLDKRIKSQLIFYLVIFFGFIAIAVFQVLKHEVGFTYPAIALICGVFLGLLAARIFRISWDHGAGRVIARLDTVGVIIFILYVALEFLQEKYLKYFIQGHTVLAVSFAVFAGIMFGRLLGIRRQVREVLKEQDIMC